MERCPLCRAALNGADTCRRCRAELRSAQQAHAEAEDLLDAAMLCLSRDDPDGAAHLLQQALALHATPQTRALWHMVQALDEPVTGERENPGEMTPRPETADAPDAVLR
jgi:hypothetical protein